MKSMQNWASKFAIALALAATQAAATPPQVITVKDALFARTDDTLFLLRTVQDNHGMHSIQQTDTLVVSRSLIGGDDRGFQIVARVIDHGTFTEPRVELLPVAAPINPYALFADFGAWPIASYAPRTDTYTTFTQDGLTLDFYGKIYSLSLNDITLRMENTLQATRAAAPMRRVGTALSGPDEFDPALFDLLRDCAVTETQLLYDLDEDPALAQLTCGVDNDTRSVTLWFVVPRVAPEVAQ